MKNDCARSGGRSLVGTMKQTVTGPLQEAELAEIEQGLEMFAGLHTERQRFEMITATMLPLRQADNLMKLWREVGFRCKNSKFNFKFEFCGVGGWVRQE